MEYLEMSAAGEYVVGQDVIERAIQSLTETERGTARRKLMAGEVIADAHGFHYRLRYLPRQPGAENI